MRGTLERLRPEAHHCDAMMTSLHHLALAAAHVGGGKAEHQKDDARGSNTDECRRDVEHGGHDQADGGEDFEGGNALDLGIGEVFDPVHFAGCHQLFSGLRELHGARAQHDDGEKALDDPGDGVHGWGSLVETGEVPAVLDVTTWLTWINH